MKALSAGLSPKQLRFMRGSSARVNLLNGSIRSGKTIVALLRWLLFIVRAPRGGALLMVGRTRDSVWRNMVAPLQDPALFGTIAAQVVGNYGAPVVTILGRKVYIMGASDAKAERVLRGMTVAGALVDEATTIPQEFFTQLLGRLSVRGAKLFATTNPDSPAHWLRTDYLDRVEAGELADWSVWHFTLDDNPSLDPSYVASIKSEFVGLWYRRFILGEWVAAEGSIYSMWDPAAHVIAHDKLPRMERLIAVGVDHGTTNPSAGVLIGYAAGRLYAIDEWRLEGGSGGQQLTVAQQAASFRTWLGDRRPTWVPVDPAAASFRLQLRAEGVPSLVPADNNVSYGIGLVASLLGERRLLISDRCTALIREVPGYAWDPKATEKGEDKPIKVADHSLDALRYAIASTENVWRGWVPKTTAA